MDAIEAFKKTFKNKTQQPTQLTFAPRPPPGGRGTAGNSPAVHLRGSAGLSRCPQLGGSQIGAAVAVGMAALFHSCRVKLKKIRFVFPPQNGPCVPSSMDHISRSRGPYKTYFFGT